MPPLEIATCIVIGLVGAIHLYFMYMEMFLWEKPKIRKLFGFTPEFASQTRKLAMNQGLYNGFLAAGLFWSLFCASDVKLFFLCCVIVAGIFGAVTASSKILWVQAAPGLIGFILVIANLK
jgi:putative membrane protein